MSQTFLGVEPTVDPYRFRLPVTNRICVGPPGNVFLFGGAGLAAGVLAAERATGRGIVWASAQFVSYAREGQTLEISVSVVQTGRNVSQVGVALAESGNTILTVNAALGDRPGQPEAQWTPAPDMPPPADCAPWSLWPKQDGGASMNDRLEVRMLPGRHGAVPRDGTPSVDGRMRMWMRAPDTVTVDAAMLAIFADYVPSAVAAAFGRPGGGNSIDNNLRVLGIVPTRWVLCDVVIDAAARGFAHGDVRLFAEDGTLMGIGSQSMIVRFVEDQRRT
jgi:acyl-CoA thioesterase II